MQTGTFRRCRGACLATSMNESQLQRSRFLAPTHALMDSARELNGDFGMTPLSDIERSTCMSRFSLTPLCEIYCSHPPPSAL